MSLEVENLCRVCNTGSRTVGGVTRMYGLFVLVSDDTIAQIETNGYLDSQAERFQEGAGDVLMVAADCDGTPAQKTYVVTRTAGDIALTAQVDAIE